MVIFNSYVFFFNQRVNVINQKRRYNLVSPSHGHDNLNQRRLLARHVFPPVGEP